MYTLIILFEQPNKKKNTKRVFNTGSIISVALEIAMNLKIEFGCENTLFVVVC